MSVDGIGNSKFVGRLSSVFQRTISQESQKDRDPQQQSGEWKEKEETPKFNFTKQELELVMKEFEELKFFKESQFNIKSEGDFPKISILICDKEGKMIRKLTAQQFIAMVKQSGGKQNPTQAGRLISKKA